MAVEKGKNFFYEELWKKHPKFDLLVSSKGQVKSLTKTVVYVVNNQTRKRTFFSQLLKQYPDRDGYLRISVRRRSVHRLVAETFWRYL